MNLLKGVQLDADNTVHNLDFSDSHSVEERASNYFAWIPTSENELYESW